MADLPVAWKKITRGLPRGRRYADDRISTLEELEQSTGSHIRAGRCYQDLLLYA